MSQLGAGFDSSFPNVIDTRQFFQNVASAAPDSNTRVDKEVLNDILSALINIETALGANIQGAFASLAARLAALESGGSPLSNVMPFTGETLLTLPGSAHQQGVQSLLYQVYDDSTPRQAVIPNTFSVYPTSYNAVITFGVEQSGVVLVAALTPTYETTFTNQTTVVVPGATHGLAQTYLFFQAYDNATPAQAIDVGSLSVNPANKDVTVTFPLLENGAAPSGRLRLAVGTPRYAQAFTSQTTVTVLGSAHGLLSADLLYQVYDASANPNAISPGGLTVHPSTFDTVLTFAAPQSGTLVLAPVPSVTPPMLMAVMPMARSVPVPLIATRGPVEDATTARLHTSVSTLDARLQALETAYQTLLAQLGGLNQEDTPR